MPKRYTDGEEKEHIVTDQLANMYHCPDCGFEYHAQHTQDDYKGGYICPLCEAIELEEKVKKYEKALSDIADEGHSFLGEVSKFCINTARKALGKEKFL